MYRNIFTNPSDIKNYIRAGEISNQILKQLTASVQVGFTPRQINELAGKLCLENNVRPSFLGVPGYDSDFPGNLCVCVNDETLHAIPFSDVPFKSGDIVKVDFGIIYEGLFTDHCITIGLGELSSDERRLISTAKTCVQTAVKNAIAGNRVGDISNALGTIAELENFGIIEGFAGHGIGRSIHSDPNIPYTGIPGKGEKLVEGMVLCIEIQISLGKGYLVMDSDGWTLRTRDGSKSAMFEQMVLVRKDNPLLLTSL